VSERHTPKERNGTERRARAHTAPARTVTAAGGLRLCPSTTISSAS